MGRGMFWCISCICISYDSEPISVDETSKARVYGRSHAGITGSNPAGGTDVCVLSVVQ
jgi:hypothetical protein